MDDIPTATQALPLKFAIVGCWGVPCKYGGFETLAEQLARNLSPAVATVSIYGSSHHFSAEEREGDFAGHKRVWLPFPAKGLSSMLHDALQILHAGLVADHARILVLGTSGAWALPIVRLLRPRTRIVTNIDGLEWRRDKFSRPVHSLLRWLERRAVRNSDLIIADNDALLPLVRETHGIEPQMIAYGGDQIERAPLNPKAGKYFLTMQRIEPENNGLMILEGMRASEQRLVFIGNWQVNAFAKDLYARFSENAAIDLHPPIYDQTLLAPIRAQSAGYIHGHSVGGTNPSLVEALFYSSRILAFDCTFNRATLEGEGAYFQDRESLARLATDPESGRIPPHRLEALRSKYRWRTIAEEYLAAMRG